MWNQLQKWVAYIQTVLKVWRFLTSWSNFCLLLTWELMILSCWKGVASVWEGEGLSVSVTKQLQLPSFTWSRRCWLTSKFRPCKQHWESLEFKRNIYTSDISRVEKNTVSGECCTSYSRPKHFVSPDPSLKIGVLKAGCEMTLEITSHFVEI